MELMEMDLKQGIIKLFSIFRQRRIQWNVAKQIASGMNFLHSLNPPVLVRKDNKILNGRK